MDWELDNGGMLDSENIEGVNRKVTPVIFMIDTSGSMSGSNIDTVNHSMEEIMSDLKNFDSADVELKYAVLTFESNCVWETGETAGLVPWDGNWKRLGTGGMTYFNTACKELRKKLSGKKEKNGLFAFALGKTITPPVIILLSDGYANDGDENGKTGITALLENKYFKGSYRIAIAIGDGANMELCQNFVGKEGQVFAVYDENALKEVLNLVVKASITVSSSGASTPPAETKQLDECVPDTTLLKEQISNAIVEEPDKFDSVNVTDGKSDWD